MHFWANPTGEKAEDGTEIMRQHYYVEGEPVDIFSMITEAALANPHLAELFIATGKFMDEHVPICNECNGRHLEQNCDEVKDWNFRASKTRIMPLHEGEPKLLTEILEKLPEDNDIQKLLRRTRALQRFQFSLDNPKLKSKEAPGLPSPEIKYRVSHQFTLYLQRAGFVRSKLPEAILKEMELCFYGAWGQLLILMRELTRLNNDQAMATMGKMMDEVGNLWESNKKGGGK